MAFEIKISQALNRRLVKLGNPDPRPLLDEAERILFEDNERRALAGLDKDDRRLATTRRELGTWSGWVQREILGRSSGGGRTRYAGTGPPLAPNGRSSRIMVLARTRSWVAADGWHAQLGWDSFDSRDGRSILAMHAQGIPRQGGTVVRDVLGVTPTAKTRARAALRAFARSLMA